MQAVTDQFKARINESHRAIIKVQLVRNGDVAWEATNTSGLSDGSISMDSDAILFRSGTCTINGDRTGMAALVPSDPSDLLAPYGTEMWVWRGIQYADGTQELVPQGRFIIYKSRVVDSGAGLQILLTLKDLGYKVSRNRFTAPYNIIPGMWYGSELFWLLYRYASWAQWVSNTWSSIPVTYTSAAINFDEGDDPWAAACKLAKDMGYRLFFNEIGQLELEVEPDDAGLISRLAMDLTEGSNLLYVDKEYTTESTYNKMVVTGTPSGLPPVTATATDNDPSSPTYINGPFGVAPKMYKSPFITTVTQAQNTANNMLRKELGGQENMHCQILPQPHLEVLDAVYVKRTASKVDAYYKINKITCPLTTDRAMDVTMSTRRVQ